MSYKHIQIILLLVAIIIWVNCKNTRQNNPMELEQVRHIFKEDKKDIIKQFSAEGAGIGKDNDNYVIVVYLKEKIPNDSKLKYWKQVPLKYEITGPIKIQ